MDPQANTTFTFEETETLIGIIRSIRRFTGDALIQSEIELLVKLDIALVTSNTITLEDKA